jgi:hypothetical protein
LKYQKWAGVSCCGGPGKNKIFLKKFYVKNPRATSCKPCKVRFDIRRVPNFFFFSKWVMSGIKISVLWVDLKNITSQKNWILKPFFHFSRLFWKNFCKWILSLRHVYFFLIYAKRRIFFIPDMTYSEKEKISYLKYTV